MQPRDNFEINKIQCKKEAKETYEAHKAAFRAQYGNDKKYIVTSIRMFNILLEHRNKQESAGTHEFRLY